MIRYTCLYMESEQDSIKFYTHLLKFRVQENMKFNNDEEWWTLKRDEHEQLGLILIKTVGQDHHKNTLLIHTQDCILEYCSIRKIAVKDLSPPIYSAWGLSFSFYDPSGNKIVFLEERKYTDLEI